MRAIIFATCSIFLVGCSAVTPSPEQQARQDAISREIKSCLGNFSYGLNRAKCINAIDEKYVRPGYPYPDLLAVIDTSRIAIAERFERKEISEAQAQAAYAKVRSEVAGEYNRRQGQNDALDMQRAALIMSSRPVTCTSFGATTNCF